MTNYLFENCTSESVKLEPVDASSLLWEERVVGASEAYVRRSSFQGVDESLGLVPVSFRLPESTYRALEDAAKEAGMNFRAYIRLILSNHVRGNE